jgi:hypothetical protein
MCHTASERQNSQTSFDGITRHAGQFGKEVDDVFGITFVQLAYLWESYGTTVSALISITDGSTLMATDVSTILICWSLSLLREVYYRLCSSSGRNAFHMHSKFAVSNKA